MRCVPKALAGRDDVFHVTTLNYCLQVSVDLRRPQAPNLLGLALFFLRSGMRLTQSRHR